jgi:hypothetical protein
VQRFLRATLIGSQSAEFIKASDLRYRVNRPDIWKKPTKTLARHQTPARGGYPHMDTTKYRSSRSVVIGASNISG